MPTVTTHYGTVYFTDIGKETDNVPPVVLVHGAAASHLVWPATLRRIPGRRVLSIDLPGHGRSAGLTLEKPGCEYVEDYAASVAQLLQALALETAIIIGHSMGGAVAQQLALDYASNVAGLVLVGTGAILRVNPEILASAQTDLPAVADMIVKWAWSRSAVTDDTARLKAQDRAQILANPPAIVYGDYLACSRFDVRERLAEISAPTLVVGGDQDKMTPLALSESLAESIQHSTLVTVVGGGHMMMLEQSATVVSAIKTWIAEQFLP